MEMIYKKECKRMGGADGTRGLDNNDLEKRKGARWKAKGGENER